MPKLWDFRDLTDSHVTLVKTTKEIVIELELSLDKKKTVVDTSLHFLNHMMETIAWGACMSLGVKVETRLKLVHTIAEDVGITLGAALKGLYERRKDTGINGTGSSLFGLDDSLARAMVSIEGRKNTFIGLRSRGTRVEKVEDMLTEDCVAFVEGLSQGMGATVHLDILKGHDPHHCWEAAFRALGEAIKQTFEQNTWRRAADNPYYPDEGIAIN